MTKPSQFPETFTLDDSDVFPVIKGMPSTPAEHKIAVADLRDELGGGGGGGVATAIYHRIAGSLTLNSASWANFPTVGTLSVPAVAGDRIEVCPNWLVGNEGQDLYIDIVTWVSGAAVNSLARRDLASGRPTGFQGIMGFRSNPSTYTPVSGAYMYEVVAGDISGGTATLQLQYRQSSATNRTIFADSGVPFSWSVKNLGQ
jgi:hypothetical protein